MNDMRVRPSGWWYVAAGVIFTAGFGVFAWGMVTGFAQMFGGISSNQQVVVPGERTVSLPSPGHYTIYHEYLSTVDGKVFSRAGSMSGLTCKLVGKATGRQVPLSAPTMNETYNIGGRSGVSILGFTIDAPGEYVLSASGPDDGGQAVLAVGRGFNWGSLTRMIASGLAMGLCILVGVLIFVLTIIKRTRCRRRMLSPQQANEP